jgi:hypothetical protein
VLVIEIVSYFVETPVKGSPASHYVVIDKLRVKLRHSA